MATLNEATLKIEQKLKLLTFVNEKTETIVKNGKHRDLERQHKALFKNINETYELKLSVEELKIENGVATEDIREWSDKLEHDIKVFEEAVDQLAEQMKTLENKENEDKKYQDRLEYEEIKQREYEEQRRIEVMKMELELQKKREENKSKESKDDQSKVRLPKLVITPFNGTHIDWFRFWNQFEAEIDRSDIAQVTKFSYLKELILPKVRLMIDGLPFTTEGYARAKNILRDKYGNTSEIVNAHVRNIMDLPTVHGTNPTKIYDFYEKLVTSVQALETMKKLEQINGYVRMTLDKIPQVRSNLVILDDNWKNWKFEDLVKELKRWTERNPPLSDIGGSSHRSQTDNQRRDKMLQIKTQRPKVYPCVYCDNTNHKSAECDKVYDISKRREILSKERRCFNCTRQHHRANECKSNVRCYGCKGQHHTSICEKIKSESGKTAADESTVIYPVVVMEINGMKCRALCDTGAGSSYISAELIKQLQLKPIRSEYKQIEMMMHTTRRKIEIFEATITDLTGKFSMLAEFNGMDKDVLLKLPNPRYEKIIKQHGHLNGVNINDRENKPELPIHIILGASEYSRIKTSSRPRVGSPGEPVAEYTTLGWTIMSPGRELEINNIYTTTTGRQDYENLCKLDVLGVEECGDDNQETVYQRFVEQLGRDKEGRYETNLLWKQEDKSLTNNKNGSIARLKALLRRLEKHPELFEKYDQIIKDQLKEGIVEKVQEEPKGKEFYIPHKAVVKEVAESTKVRIVYDASARERDSTASLNECLETGPPLQNQIFNILLRNRLKPIALTGDMKQAFLQIRIREEDRDCLRFHWIKDKDANTFETLRFTRAIFGLVQSPFLLGGTVKYHLSNTKIEQPELTNHIEEIEDNLYVDDVITGGDTQQQVAEIKETAIQVFKDAKFELHKWHSNIQELEEPNADQLDQSYAKQQLSVKPNETKILGVHWDKREDNIGISIPQEEVTLTKRGILHYLASIYDPIGIISPILLTGKQFYREACISHLSWDQKLPENLTKKWNSWITRMPKIKTVPRCIAQHHEMISDVELHAFADASGKGVCSALYAVVHQPSGISKGLLASKSRLSKDGLTIPRLELVATNMAANLLENAKNSLKAYNISKIIGWTDSTVALHWINGNGQYKQFVSNRIKKIQEKKFITWRYVSTNENPADLGSRGCLGDNLTELWFQGPAWLTNEMKWPPNIQTVATKESEKEAKLIKEVFQTATEPETSVRQKLLVKYKLWKALRVSSWINRFKTNCLEQKKVKGPLTTTEINSELVKFVRWSQQENMGHSTFNDVREKLNLQENEEGLLECRGRIQGEFPIFIPRNGILAEKIVEDAHLKMLHGGVGITMTAVRENYWIQKLRQLSKQVIRRCYGCKRFQTTALRRKTAGLLPTDRTDGQRPFQVVGTDYAGPLLYKTRRGEERKAYILLFACSLTRAVHIELLENQTTEEFIKCLKQFVARRGRPSKIYSDNAKTFKAAANWLYCIMKGEKLHEYLAERQIDWRFNLSRAPWWGGQFERIIGLIKQALYKCVGKANLLWDELVEVLLDVEITLNNRPLSYVEDDIEMPVLTPNLMLHGEPTKYLLEENEISVSDKELRRRAKYLKKCKDATWQRWRSEYLRGLRERHNLINKESQNTNIKEGDVMLIKGDEKNRGKWRMGIVSKLFKGKDKIVRAVQLRSGKTYLERAIQHLYPLELSCDMVSTKIKPQEEINEKRPIRKAALEARHIIRQQAVTEANPPEVE